MNRKNSVPLTNLKKIFGYGIFVILTALAIGMFAVSYVGGATFLLGIVTYFLLHEVFNLAKIIIPKRYYKWLSVLFRYVIFLVLIVTLLMFFPGGCASNPPTPCAILYYHLIIKPKDSQLGRFSVQEFIVLDPKILEKLNTNNLTPSNWESVKDNRKGFELPETEVVSNNHGFLLKEVIFEPSDIYNLPGVSFLDPYFLMDYEHSPSCGKAIIELRDFPLNSFYAAREAYEIKRYSYIDTETITWSSWNLSERDIRFAYVPPPFLLFKPLVTPFLGASSLNQWVIGLIGVLSAVIFTPIVKPVFVDILQNIFKKKIDGVVTPMKEITKIIVSSKGDEKEIEGKKDNNSRN